MQTLKDHRLIVGFFSLMGAVKDYILVINFLSLMIAWFVTPAILAFKVYCFLVTIKNSPITVACAQVVFFFFWVCFAQICLLLNKWFGIMHRAEKSMQTSSAKRMLASLKSFSVLWSFIISLTTGYLTFLFVGIELAQHARLNTAIECYETPEGKVECDHGSWFIKQLATCMIPVILFGLVCFIVDKRYKITERVTKLSEELDSPEETKKD